MSESTDFLKAAADHFKHLTTVCSGFVLVIFAFVDKVSEASDWKWAALGSLPLFFVCILLSVAAQAYYIDYIRRPDSYLVDAKRGLTLGFALGAWGSFMLAVLLLVIFATRNILA